MRDVRARISSALRAQYSLPPPSPRLARPQRPAPSVRRLPQADLAPRLRAHSAPRLQLRRLVSLQPPPLGRSAPPQRGASVHPPLEQAQGAHLG